MLAVTPPVADNVVNAAVPGVTLPIATACNALAVAVFKVVAPLAPNVVNCAVPGVTLPIAVACNPPAVTVVNAPVFGVTLPITPWKLLAVSAVNAPVPGVTAPTLKLLIVPVVPELIAICPAPVVV